MMRRQQAKDDNNQKGRNIAAAFGGVSGGAGESGYIYSGVNSAVGTFGAGGNKGDSNPAAYLNYILFDNDYKVMNMG
jgi:hypothetical protein